jgi:hypothetical protein
VYHGDYGDRNDARRFALRLSAPRHAAHTKSLTPT